MAERSLTIRFRRLFSSCPSIGNWKDMPSADETRFFFNPSNPISSLYNGAMLTKGALLFFLPFLGMVDGFFFNPPGVRCQTQMEQRLSLYCDQSAGGFVHSHCRFCFFSVDEKRGLICKLRNVFKVCQLCSYFVCGRYCIHSLEINRRLLRFCVGRARNRREFFLKTARP